MADRLVMGIDLGTTGCRAVAFGENGARLASHYVEYGVTHPEPGAAEQEAEGWWSAARACVKAVVEQLPAPDAVVAVGISAQGHSWVPTSDEFRPLRPGLTWLDTRAAGIARELLETRGAHFWGQRAGKVPGPWHALPQLLWLREKEPQVERAAAHCLFAHDFLIARLTGKPVTDFTTAAGSLLFNIREFEWDRKLALQHGVDTRRFSPALPAGSVAGALGWDVAKDLGLAAAIPVAVGAQDQKCAALAAGVEEGVATVSLGTSTAITALTRHPVFDEAAAIPCFPYLARNTWVLEAPLTTSGGALRWLRDFHRAAGVADMDYPALTGLAATAPGGSNGVCFLPFLAGAGAPHWVGEARGSITGIGLDTTPGDVARALLEGVAYEIRTNLDAMRQQGVEIKRLRLFGGGARADLWVKIIATVTGLPVERSADVETAVAGAAILALAASGVCKSIAEAQERLRPAHEAFEPTAGVYYEDLYAHYVAVRDGYWRTARNIRP